MEIAKTSGFNAVKFQKRDPDICVPDHQRKLLEKLHGEI